MEPADRANRCIRHLPEKTSWRSAALINSHDASFSLLTQTTMIFRETSFLDFCFLYWFTWFFQTKIPISILRRQRKGKTPLRLRWTRALPVQIILADRRNSLTETGSGVDNCRTGCYVASHENFPLNCTVISKLRLPNIYWQGCSMEWVEVIDTKEGFFWNKKNEIKLEFEMWMKSASVWASYGHTIWCASSDRSIPRWMFRF